MKTQDTVVSPSATSTGFLRTAMLATSGGLGLMLASLASVENVDGSFRFVWSGWVVAAFAVGVGLGMFYWRAAFRLGSDVPDSAATVKRMKNFKIVSAVLVVAAVFAFLYPMKFVRPEKRADVRAGLIMVPFFVIPVVSMWYFVKRYIDADAAKSEAEEADRQ